MIHVLHAAGGGVCADSFFHMRPESASRQNLFTHTTGGGVCADSFLNIWPAIYFRRNYFKYRKLVEKQAESF